MSSHLLLTLHLDGQVVRVATDDVDVTDAARGRVYHYRSGISDMTVSSALSFIAASGPLSVPVEAVLPVDVAAVVAAGVSLDGSVAEVALWTEGDDYGSRIILASATVSGAEWGEYGEPVRFSIERPATTSTNVIPTAVQQVNATTWETVLDLDPSDLGQFYPHVFGQAGVTGAGTWVTAGQIVWFAYGTSGTDFVAVVAGHASNQNYVMLSSDDAVAGAQFAVWQTVDGRGQAVSVIAKYANYPISPPLNTYVDARGETIAGILLNAWSNPTIGAPKAVWMSWISPLADDTGGLSPLAGDVIRYVLQRAGVPVDYGRFEAAARLLAGYRFDCVIDTPTPCLEWLRTAVYPLIPVSVVSGPSGDYPVVWRYDTTPADSTVDVDADRDPAISRASALKADSSAIVNAFTIQYQYSVRTGSYTATATRDSSTCPYCAASERKWGRVEKVIETVIVYDAATASSILAWMARAYTVARLTVSYVVPSTYRLTRGQVVTLTDSLVSLSAVLCQVEDVQVDGTGMDGVTFRLSP